MKREEFLSIVKKRIHFVYDRGGIEIELNQHIQDSKEDLLQEGLSVEEAEELAVVQMGDPVEIGILLNREHHPLIGYAWLASKLILITLVVLIVFPIGQGFLYQMMPQRISNVETSYEINVKAESPIYYMEIQDVVITARKNTLLTYRLWRKYSYTRAARLTDVFRIEDSEGAEIGKGGSATSNMFGENGALYFEWPEDDIMCIVLGDDNVVRIDLKEYCDE